MAKKAKKVLAFFAAVLIVSAAFFMSANSTPPPEGIVRAEDTGGDGGDIVDGGDGSLTEPADSDKPNDDNQLETLEGEEEDPPVDNSISPAGPNEGGEGDGTSADPDEECQHDADIDTVKWSRDDTYHWKICPNPDCKVELLKAAHTPDENGKCTVCEPPESTTPPAANNANGPVDEQPNGNSGEDHLSAGTHVHDWGDWKPDEDGDTHTRTCKADGCDIQTETEKHEYDEKGICTQCAHEKAPESAPLPSVNKIVRKADEQQNVTTSTPTLHEHDWGKWTPNDGKNTHTRTCKTDSCGKTETGDHDAKGAEGKCSVCGGYHEHKYDDLHFAWTSDGHQQICTVKGCNETKTNLVSHKFDKNGTCICGHIENSGSAEQWKSNTANPNLAENLIEQIGKNKNFFGVYYNENYPTLNASVLAAIQGKGVDLVAADGRVKWAFKGTNIPLKYSKDIDLYVGISALKESANKDKISPLVGNANTYVLSFAENGPLPGSVGIRVNMDEIFKSSPSNPKNLWVYYFNPVNRRLEPVGDNDGKCQIKDGCLHFSIYHNSDYVITDRRISSRTWDDDDDDEEDSEDRTSHRFAEVRPNDTGKKENPHTGGY